MVFHKLVNVMDDDTRTRSPPRTLTTPTVGTAYVLGYGVRTVKRSPKTQKLDETSAIHCTLHNHEDSSFGYILGSNKCAGGIYMVDISDPSDPAYVGYWDEEGYNHYVQCGKPVWVRRLPGRISICLLLAQCLIYRTVRFPFRDFIRRRYRCHFLVLKVRSR
jgi:hypothetical protein